MSFANRYARTVLEMRPLIAERECWDRVCSAIRVSNAEVAVRPSGIKSNWPAEFEHVSTAIKWAVWRGKPLEDKLYRKLMAGDFEDIWFEKTEGAEERERSRFAAKEVTDAITAGVWFASLQRRREFVSETLEAYELYRIGAAKTALITDQKILSWYALGWSLKAIADHKDIRQDEHKVGAALNRICREVFFIANGLHKGLVDLDEERRRRRVTATGGDQACRERA